MIENIIHKCKPGMLKHTLRVGAGTWNAIRKPKHKYYVRAEFKSSGANKRKREVNFKFNWMHYIDSITTDYNVFMSSWFDSYAATISGPGTSFNSNTFGEFMSGFCNHITHSTNSQLHASELELVGNLLGSFGSARVSDIYPTDFVHSFVRVTASNECVSPELALQDGLYLVCTFLGSSDLLYDGGNYKNFEGLRLPPTSDSASLPQPIFLKVNEMALSDYGNLRSSDNNQIAFRQLHYLRGEVPLGYDDSYNDQMWLPLLDSSARDRPFFRTSVQPVLRSTQCLWAVGTLTANDSNIPVKFLGECYKYDSTHDDRVEHKNNLADYPLTTDISLKGKGYMYIDNGDVCYCPITGFALECVVEILPEYSDATGNSFGLE